MVAPTVPATAVSRVSESVVETKLEFVPRPPVGMSTKIPTVPSVVTTATATSVHRVLLVVLVNCRRSVLRHPPDTTGTLEPTVPMVASVTVSVTSVCPTRVVVAVPQLRFVLPPRVDTPGRVEPVPTVAPTVTATPVSLGPRSVAETPLGSVLPPHKVTSTAIPTVPMVATRVAVTVVCPTLRFVPHVLPVRFVLQPATVTSGRTRAVVAVSTVPTVLVSPVSAYLERSVALVAFHRSVNPPVTAGCPLPVPPTPSVIQVQDLVRLVLVHRVPSGVTEVRSRPVARTVAVTL